MTGLPIYRTLRSAALGGASLFAIVAVGLSPVAGEETPKSAMPPQLADRAGEQPPLTDKDTPWDQSRAEAARDATKALTAGIEGFKAVAQQAILTHNPGLLHAMKALIKYYGELCAALSGRAQDLLLGNNANVTRQQPLTSQGTRAVRETIGNGEKGKQAADHALEEIEKFQVPAPQQSRAPALRSATEQTASAGSHQLFNTVVPESRDGLPTICSDKCTASLDDSVFAWDKNGIGDERLAVSDLCRLSSACMPIANQPGKVQFSPVDRPEQNVAAINAARKLPATDGQKTIAMTSGSYLNPFLSGAVSSWSVSGKSWATLDRWYTQYRSSINQESANAGRNDVSRALTNMYRRSDFINYGAMTDLSASNVLMKSYMSFLEGLYNNRSTGDDEIWKSGIAGVRRLAAKQVLNEDFNNYAKRERIPAGTKNGAKFWSGHVLQHTASTNDTLRLTADLDWKGRDPHIGETYASGPRSDETTNGYYRYTSDPSGSGAGDRYVPAQRNVQEPTKRVQALDTTETTDTLSFGLSQVLRRNLTYLVGISSVTDMRGMLLGYTADMSRSLRIAQLAAPGKGCDSLDHPSGQFGDVSFTNRPNFFWTVVVPATSLSGAVCELGLSWPFLFYSTQQQLIAKRNAAINRAIDEMLSYLYSYFYGCDYYYYYYGPPRLRVGWESTRLLYTQSPAPNDPLASSKGTWRQSYDDQWWLKAIDWLKPDGTTVLPDKARPVTVAVIDSGIDLRHPELFGALWVNPSEPEKPPHPGEFRNPMRAHWFGWNFLEDSGDIRDYNGHGTIVAGIIAAGVNDGLGIAGINPWAKIMPLKVADHRGRTSNFAAAKAIVYAADHGARVINMSLGNEKISEVVRRAIDYAARKNVLIVVSSGNKGVDVKDFTPSAFANTIAVAAVDHELKRAGFSNFGDNIAISAPGVGILSLRAGGTDLMQFVRDDYKPGSAIVNNAYYRVDGTSFAAPMVAGVASLILSVHPELSAAEVKRMILQSARDIGEPGRDRNLGYGLLDADAALKADPAFFVDGMISGLSVARVNGRQAVEVKGTATANRMRAAWVEIGQGENPTSWKKVTESITKPVENGVIGDIDARNFAGAKVWTVRVVVEHENGRRREGRFVLRLG